MIESDVGGVLFFEAERHSIYVYGHCMAKADLRYVLDKGLLVVFSAYYYCSCSPPAAEYALVKKYQFRQPTFPCWLRAILGKGGLFMAPPLEDCLTLLPELSLNVTFCLMTFQRKFASKFIQFSKSATGTMFKKLALFGSEARRQDRSILAKIQLQL